MYIRIFTTLAVMLSFLIGMTGDISAMPPYQGDPKDPDCIGRANAANIAYASMQADWAVRGVDEPSDMNFGDWLASSTTSKNILCILIEFTDRAGIVQEEFFDTLVYGQSVTSVRDYYDEVSYGQLDIVTIELPSDLGWVTAGQDLSYYVGSNYGTGSYPNNCQKLVEEAVDLVDGMVDFSQYDNDSDGWVDGLMVVHSGPGAEFTHSTSDIWSHKWSISPRSKDGVYVYTYSMMPEYWSSSGDMTIGVFCHELGHVFGLPDLYDRDYSSNGIGRWSIMAAGSWNGSLGSSPAHFDAWCRTQLGFASATNVLTNMTNVEIPSVEESGTIYKLWTNGAIGNEYFLIENRQKTGYDSYLPGEGLLIWHIDNTVSHNDNEWYPEHTSSGNYRVALVQADNLWSMEKAMGYGDAGDPYPGTYSVTEFSPTTSPNSNDYDDVSTLVAVTNISSSADTMTADLSVSMVAATDEDNDDGILPQHFTVSQNYPNPFNGSTVIEYSVSSGGTVRIEVFNILGQLVYSSEETVSPGDHTFEWTATTSNGEEISSGTYFTRVSHDNREQIRKMLYLK